MYMLFEYSYLPNIFGQGNLEIVQYIVLDRA